MAVTEIHPITQTPYLALDYIKKDKVMYQDEGGKFYEEFKDYINEFIEKETGRIYFVYKTISTGLNCSLKNDHLEMQKVRKAFGKDNKNLMHSMYQNFGEKIDPRVANEIGCKLAAELFPQFQCVVSTHINTGHVHNHITFNATSFLDGIKYADNHKTKREIRKASDKLCKEYGLKTLEETKDMKLIKYKDDKGKIKFYEPTERKDKLRKNEFANANDYRDTKAYDEQEVYKKSNNEVIKDDIKRLLTYSTSYENLLKLLADNGYTIKAKTSTGEYRKHISFQAPGQLKATRDSSLGEEYTREILTEFIDKQIQHELTVNSPEVETAELKINDKEIYKLGRINIDSLDENVRYNVDLKKQSSRSPIEKKVVQDTKCLHYEYKTYTRTRTYTFIQSDYKSQQLEKSINRNLSALYFMETNSRQSFTQINDMTKMLYEKRAEVAFTMTDIKSSLDAVNVKIALIKDYEHLQKRVQNTDPGYIQIDREADLADLKKYEKLLSKYNLLGNEKQARFVENANKYTEIYTKLQAESERINNRISEYDKLVDTIKNIDQKISDNAFDYDIAKYEQNRSQEREENKNESKNSNTNKKYER